MTLDDAVRQYLLNPEGDHPELAPLLEEYLDRVPCTVIDDAYIARLVAADSEESKVRHAAPSLSDLLCVLMCVAWACGIGHGCWSCQPTPTENSAEPNSCPRGPAPMPHTHPAVGTAP